MAQTRRGGSYGPPSKGHHGVCAIYSETTVNTNPNSDLMPLAGCERECIQDCPQDESGVPAPAHRSQTPKDSHPRHFGGSL